MHENHRKRVRERYFSGGFEGMTDSEALEMLLFYCIPRKDTVPMANALLEHFGSLSCIFEASPEGLTEVDGIGENAAAFLTMIPKICRRYLTDKYSVDISLDDREGLANFISSLYIGKKSEEINLLCFDGTGRIKSCFTFDNGDTSGVSGDLKEMIACALRCNSRTVIISHNHPDAVSSPSKDDVESTERVIKTFNENSIKVADHFIVGADGYLSMAFSAKFRNLF